MPAIKASHKEKKNRANPNRTIKTNPSNSKQSFKVFMALTR